jgi:hypothetical protein
MSKTQNKSEQNTIAKVLLVLVLIIILSYSVSALGVAPSRKVVDHRPGLQEYSFRVINNDNKDVDLALYARDELGDYFILENQVVHIAASENEKEIKYQINLPDELEPGVNKGEIVIMEVPESGVVFVGDDKKISFKRDNTFITSSVGVTHQLRVNVPYPGVYAQGELFMSNVGDTENKLFTIALLNLGSEPIDAYAEIIIKGPTNQEIARVRTNSVSLDPEKEGKLSATWIADVMPGNYYAEAVVYYNNKHFTTGKMFSVGNLVLYVDELSVGQFRLGAIAKFDALLRSTWNEPVREVYGDMQIIQEGNVLSEFKTATVDVPAKGTATISGYWDTNGVEVGEYDVNVILHYAGKTSEKLFKAVVGIDEIIIKESDLLGKVIDQKTTAPDRLSILIILVSIVVIANIFLIVYVRKRNKEK